MARKAPVAEHVARGERTLYEVDGLAKGDPVKVKGEQGQWRFQYATTTPEGEVESYTVFGGLNGRGAMRAFVPSRVTLSTKGKRLRGGKV